MPSRIGDGDLLFSLFSLHSTCTWARGGASMLGYTHGTVPVHDRGGGLIDCARSASAGRPPPAPSDALLARPARHSLQPAGWAYYCTADWTGARTSAELLMVGKPRRCSRQANTSIRRRTYLHPGWSPWTRSTGCGDPRRLAREGETGPDPPASRVRPTL